MDILLYLLQLIQQLYKQNCFPINFIGRYIPLKQWPFDESHSPKYEKFVVDQLPRIDSFKQDWEWSDLIFTTNSVRGKLLNRFFVVLSTTFLMIVTALPVMHPFNTLCGMMAKKSQIRCKVCHSDSPPSQDNRFTKANVLRCPHCSNTLVPKKDRKHFIVHKYVKPKILLLSP